MSRCTGHCCRRVIVQFSPYELARCKQSIENGLMTFMLDSGEEFTNHYALEEITKVEAMLLWLGTSDVDPADGTKMVDKAGQPRFEHNYTCRHFDEVSGNCLNYENRPKMCSMYPYQRACHYRECTSDCSVANLNKIAAHKTCSKVDDLQVAMKVNEIVGRDWGHD